MCQSVPHTLRLPCESRRENLWLVYLAHQCQRHGPQAWQRSNHELHRISVDCSLVKKRRWPFRTFVQVRRKSTMCYELSIEIRHVMYRKLIHDADQNIGTEVMSPTWHETIWRADDAAAAATAHRGPALRLRNLISSGDSRVAAPCGQADPTGLGRRSQTRTRRGARSNSSMGEQASEDLRVGGQAGGRAASTSREPSIPTTYTLHEPLSPTSSSPPPLPQGQPTVSIPHHAATSSYRTLCDSARKPSVFQLVQISADPFRNLHIVSHVLGHDGRVRWR